MKKLYGIALGALVLASAATLAIAQQSPPQVSTINPNDLFQDVVNGAPTPGNFYAPGSLFSSIFGIGAPSRNNALVGGDASTNLWQRGTTGSSVTTTATYGGPDRWAYWSGTSTAMTVSRSNTAAALPAAYQQTFRMQRTASQTGVVQMCLAQEVESVNSYQFQGQVAELDFHAYLGANYSGGTSLTAYIITGTGSDEGMSALAFGLNAGGGGGAGWTGQANATAAVIPLSTVSTGGRYAAIGLIPAAATEIGVAICYTPTGTAGTTDAVYLAGIQLVRNPLNAAFVNTGVGYSSTTQYLTMAGFERRSQQAETAMQQRYFWEVAEPAASIGVGYVGTYDTTTTCELTVQTPVSMRAAPTLAFGGTALGATTWAIIANSATPIVLASTWLVQSTLGANTINSISITSTTAAKTAGFACKLVGAGGGSNIQASAEL